MPNNQRERQNPFLVILLKAFINYEFVGINHNSSNRNIAALIYDRYKDEQHSNTFYKSHKSVIDSLAFSRAETIRKHILEKDDYNFSSQKLDEAVSLLSKLGKFDSWIGFKNKFKAHPMTLQTEAEYMHVDFSQLDSKIRDRISSQAWAFFYQLYQQYSIGYMQSKNIIISTYTHAVRTPNLDEIKEIETLADRIYPCSINRFSIKKKWYAKNENIFFIYYTELGLMGNVNLLPLHDDCFENLRAGKIYESQIMAMDIYSLNEKEKVNYVYMEGLAITSKKVLMKFAISFRRLLSEISNPDNPQLVICAIGGSMESAEMMKMAGFKITGWNIDPMTGDKFPFFEIPWHELEVNLKNRRLLDFSFGYEGVLTPYKNP